MTGKCPKCNAPADGLDDIHCQMHWEELCNQGWWEMMEQSGKLMTVEEVQFFLADHNPGAVTVLVKLQELEDWAIAYQCLIDNNIRGSAIHRMFKHECDSDIFKFFTQVTGMISNSQPRKPWWKFW